MKKVHWGGATLAMAIGISLCPAVTPALGMDGPAPVVVNDLPVRSEAPETVPTWSIEGTTLTIGPGTFSFADGERKPWASQLWGVTKVQFTDPTHTAIVGSAEHMFGSGTIQTIEGINGVDMSRVTNMSFMFSGASKLESLDVANWNVSNVTTAHHMFYGASALTTLDVSGWKTGALENANAMFAGARSLTDLDVSLWDTSSLQDAASMFWGASSLSTLDVGSWTTESLEVAWDMFSGASSLTSLNVSNWETGKLYWARGMFASMPALETLDVSRWDTSSLRWASEMFSGASALTTLDVSQWETPALETGDRMFAGMAALTSLDVSRWETRKLGEAEEMFAGMTSITELDLGQWVSFRFPPHEGKPTYHANLFAGTPLRSLTVPRDIYFTDEIGLNPPSDTDGFTGKWDVSGDWEGTTEDLISRTNQQERFDTPDTYVWQSHATLVLNPNGGTGDPITLQSTANKKFKLSAEVFALLNSKLSGWNDRANGTGKSFEIGDTFVLPAGVTTLYAQWKSVPVDPIVDPTVDPPTPPVVDPVTQVKPVSPVTGKKLVNTGGELGLMPIISAFVLAAGGTGLLLHRRRARKS